MAGRAVAAGGGGGVGDGAGGGGDIDAAQVRMHGEIGGGVDAGKGDVGGGEFLREGRRVGGAEHGGDLAVLAVESRDARDVGGKRRIGGERGIAQDHLRPARATRGRSGSK